MKEVPIRYVKANQTGIVLFVILALLLQQPWILLLLWIIQTAGLLTGGKLNLFVAAAKPFLRNTGGETQAIELQRFNNLLAVLFLTLAVICFAVGWQIAGYAFCIMLLAAAGAALLGYCIGCTLYFQIKQLLARRQL
ncbi:DUF4395 domain-containing protein [Mycobacterium gordonae]|nr:DUF4395 domain-containing protein [Mycobacterium gordonae]